MIPLQHYLKDFKGTIRWTPADPEKRNTMSANWSRDKVATGNVDFDIDCQYELIELQFIYYLYNVFMFIKYK